MKSNIIPNLFFAWYWTDIWDLYLIRVALSVTRTLAEGTKDRFCLLKAKTKRDHCDCQTTTLAPRHSSTAAYFKAGDTYKKQNSRWWLWMGRIEQPFQGRERKFLFLGLETPQGLKQQESSSMMNISDVHRKEGVKFNSLNCIYFFKNYKKSTVNVISLVIRSIN